MYPATEGLGEPGVREPEGVAVLDGALQADVAMATATQKQKALAVTGFIHRPWGPGSGEKRRVPTTRTVNLLDPKWLAGGVANRSGKQGKRKAEKGGAAQQGSADGNG
jgi:hypothetical protein